MNIRINEEWVHWGEVNTDFVGFFSTVSKAEEHEGMIYVECKYGKYCLNPSTQEVSTIEGVDYETLVEVAKYGMGYKYWENEPST